MPQGISMIEINYEDDVVTARQRARQVARLFSFDEQDQTRISTALSEIARLFVQAHKGGRIEFQLEGSTPPQLLLVTISSPEPTMTALMIRPGPSWRRMPAKSRGAGES